ncbi:MAG TPA: alcohol dehydrogenase catalytic domain-containing protein [Gaiellaceae bacterium]|nr:alcohol dehydrogenase catalytic domain-containing protein [Gaiellaceae bacterium]
MRAVVLDADGLPELVELPEPTGQGLLVRVHACGLCGSDVEKLGRAAPGTVLGHEVVGELANGDRVTVVHHVPCGVCERCQAGHQSTCGEFRELRIAPGGFAERLRATFCVPLPDSFGPHDGVWVEPLACVLRGAEHVPAGRVAVVGCGAIGQLWIQALARRGSEVVALDPRPDRLARARELGAVVDDDPVAAAVLTAHAGANDALRRLAPGGTLLVFAAPGEPVPVDLDAVYRKELVVAGTRSATPAYFRDAIELLPSLVLPETTTLPLERFVEGVELYRRGEALKVVFVP